MTSSFVHGFAYALVLSVAAPAWAQTPPTAGFPVESAPSGSAAAPPSTTPPNAPTAPSAGAPAPPVAPPAPAPSTSSAPSAAPPPSTTPPPATAPARVTPAPAPESPPAPPPVAAPGTLDGLPPPDDSAFLPQPSLLPEIGFQRDPRWAVGIEGRAGVGMMAHSDARGAFAFAGAVLRGHVSYFEVGGFYDHADTTATGGTFSHAGGFVGAWLPYSNWVDFDAALGFGVRHYVDSDARYGASGYSVNCPALSLLLGVSDRARADKFGLRVGGGLVLTQDFGQKDKQWAVQETNAAGEVVSTNGTTHVGGFSASLVFTLGFDYGESP